MYQPIFAHFAIEQFAVVGTKQIFGWNALPGELCISNNMCEQSLRAFTVFCYLLILSSIEIGGCGWANSTEYFCRSTAQIVLFATFSFFPKLIFTWKRETYEIVKTQMLSLNAKQKKQLCIAGSKLVISLHSFYFCPQLFFTLQRNSAKAKTKQLHNEARTDW